MIESNAHRISYYIALAALVALNSCSGGSREWVVPTNAPEISASNVTDDGTRNARPLCPPTRRQGYARCFSWIRTDVTPSMQRPPHGLGYAPSDLQTAYNLPSSINGDGQTVGVVDAYDNPDAENDLGAYRNQYGLSACTTANGCFKKVNQSGGATYPSGDQGWGAEIDLDIEMVSAICPNCHIVLVEANSPTFKDFNVAEDQAVLQGSGQVSNSYGLPEYVAKNRHYTHSHVVITASSGDSGYAPQQPCSWATVVCVGGTVLSKVSPRSEAGWTGAGSGCSAFVLKPKFQTDQGCAMRSEADASAIASPAYPVSVYDSYGYGGWIAEGGTSVASPIIASVFALAGNHASQRAAKALWAAGGFDLNDITQGGKNGNCPPAYPYICQPGLGYDGPTGWGTPNGIDAF